MQQPGSQAARDAARIPSKHGRRPASKATSKQGSKQARPQGSDQDRWALRQQGTVKPCSKHARQPARQQGSEAGRHPQPADALTNGSNASTHNGAMVTVSIPLHFSLRKRLPVGAQNTNNAAGLDRLDRSGSVRWEAGPGQHPARLWCRCRAARYSV